MSDEKNYDFPVNWDEPAELDSQEFETDLLSFNLTNGKIANTPAGKIFGKYRNLTDVEEDKVVTHKVWIKRAGVNLVLRHFPQVIHKINVLVNKLATKFSLDLHDMWLELAITGLFYKIKEMNNLAIEMDDQFYRELGALLEYERIAVDRNIVDTLTPIFESKSRPDFETWCIECHWDYEKFYELRNQEMRKLSFSKRSKMWIHDKVSGLAEPMKVEEFIKCAMKQGILDENQYNAFYQHIGRLGFLNRPYGYVFDD